MTKLIPVIPPYLLLFVKSWIFCGGGRTREESSCTFCGRHGSTNKKCPATPVVLLTYIWTPLAVGVQGNMCVEVEGKIKKISKWERARLLPPESEIKEDEIISQIHFFGTAFGTSKAKCKTKVKGEHQLTTVIVWNRLFCIFGLLRREARRASWGEAKSVRF